MTVVVDTSALVAVVFGEEDAEQIAASLVDHTGALQISAATLLEALIVVEARQGPEAVLDLRGVIQHLGITVAPVDVENAALAFAAWQRFGKGRHGAALNFGDCFSYALAKQLGAPLLFKGDDFAQTDVSTV